ncbi:MAG: DUF2461 domain-containing protein [Bacteroidota bacterium]
MQIQKSLLPYLSDLATNNNREWFLANRKRYDIEKEAFQQVIGYLLKEIGQFENLDGQQIKDCSYRINRDIRFSADKSPYKKNFSCSFEQGGKKSGRAGYYLHIQPGNSFLAGGAWGPTKEQLMAIRQEIDYNGKHLHAVIDDSKFKEVYSEIKGDGLKTMPKGYPKDHPEIELLKKNQLYVMHNYTDNEVVAADFLDKVVAHCKIMKPFADWVNLVCF